MIARIGYLYNKLLGSRSAANFGWMVTDKLARMVFGGLTGFVVARYLGPEGYGAYNYVAALVSMAAMMAGAGFDAILRRDLLVVKNEAPELLATAFVLRLAIGLLIYILSLIYLLFGHTENQEWSLFAVLGLLLFQPGLQIPEIWFNSYLKAGVVVRIQVGALVLAALLRLWFVWRRAPLVAFAWASVLEIFGASLFQGWHAIRHGMRLRWTPKWFSLAGRLMRESWPILLSGLSVIVYTRIDAVMLKQMVGERAVGEYAAATKFTELWLFMPGALMISLLPTLLAARAENQKAYAQCLQRCLDLNAALAYLIAFPTALGAHWLVRLAYGTAYAGGSAVLSVHIWIVVFAAIGTVRSQFCVIEGFTKFLFFSTFGGAVLNVGLNLLLIPRFGPFGAAIATLLSQALVAWISSYFSSSTRAIAYLETRAMLIVFRFPNYLSGRGKFSPGSGINPS